MVIGVVGLWHLGETVAVGLASLGHRVIGIDTNKETIEKLLRGVPPLQEPGLEELLVKHLASQTLSFSSDFSKLAECEAVFITFDTPIAGDDTPDTAIIFDAAKKIASHIKNDAVVVVMSQVPAGTSLKILATIKEIHANFQGEVAYVPENLQLGRALDSFLKPARTVIGTDSLHTKKVVEDIFIGLPGERLYMNTASAEMSKHALNAFLATSLSFIYNIADVCESTGANVVDVTRALKSDPRIGRDAYLDASIGFSGGTLMRDIRTLCNFEKEIPVISGVSETLGARIASVPKRIEKIVGLPLSQIKGALFGLTYKKGTPTVRRSLSIDIMRMLESGGAKTVGYDPSASESELLALGITKAKNPYDAALGAHIILVMTELDEFLALDFALLKAKMATPYAIFDARNFLKDKAEALTTLGMRYIGIGRGDINDTQK